MASLVADYGSEEEEHAARRTRFTGDFFAAAAASSSSSSDDEEEVEALLPAAPAAPSFLPAVDSLFASVSAPAFLRPEATRPLAEVHSRAQGGDGARRSAASSVTGSAVRFTAKEAEKRAALTALRREEQAAAAEAVEECRPQRRPSRAVSVQDALANPGAVLPRQQQDRKVCSFAPPSASAPSPRDCRSGNAPRGTKGNRQSARGKQSRRWCSDSSTTASVTDAGDPGGARAQRDVGRPTGARDQGRHTDCALCLSICC